MEVKVLDTSHIFFELKDDVLFVTYKGKITLDVAKEGVKNRMKITEGKTYPVLVQGVNVSAFEKEARDYLASAEGIAGVKAGAIYVDSVFTSLLGNFFLKVTVIKPKVPTKIFTNKAKALKWLEQYK